MQLPFLRRRSHLFAVEAIFTALDWIDDGGLQKVCPEKKSAPVRHAEMS
jgi:hypothetical protein